MKQLPFEYDRLHEDLERSRGLTQVLSGHYSAQYFCDIGVHVFCVGDLSEHEAYLVSMREMTVWIFHYVAMVLADNMAVLRRKKPPYRFKIRLDLDMEQSLFQALFYVDSEVYSLVVGREHRNIFHLVRALFPVFSKNRFENNIRFVSFD